MMGDYVPNGEQVNKSHVDFAFIKINEQIECGLAFQISRASHKFLMATFRNFLVCLLPKLGRQLVSQGALLSLKMSLYVVVRTATNFTAFWASKAGT